jgi:hypothetical protein
MSRIAAGGDSTGSWGNGSNSNGRPRCRPFHDNNEWRGEFRVGYQKRLDGHQGEPGIDVTRSQIQDAEAGLAGQNGQRAKVGIVGHNYPTFLEGSTQQFDIRTSLPATFAHIPNVKTQLTQASNNGRVDVLIRQQATVSETHGTMPTP